MKKAIALCLMVWGSVLTFGQTFTLNKNQQTSASGTWIWDRATGQFSIIGKSNTAPEMVNGLQVFKIQQIGDYFYPQEYKIPFEFHYQDGDLVIEYNLPEEPNSRRYANVGIDSVIFNGQYIKPLRIDLSGDLDSVHITEKAEPHRIVWNNAYENYIHRPEGDLRIILTADKYEMTPRFLYEEPKFTFRNKLPAYVSIGTGIGLLIAAYAINENASDIYDNQYKTQFFEDVAEPFYQDANSKRHRAFVVGATGGALIFGGGAYFLSKWLKYQKEQRIADRYYQGKNWSSNSLPKRKKDLTVVPQVSPTFDGELYSGIYLNYSF